MRKTLLPLCFLAFSMPALSGCGIETGAAIAGASLVSYVTTDKLPTDHVASAASGEDCSVRNVVDGDAYCSEVVDPEMEQLREANAQPYCYYTLGSITCYDTPDPYNNNEVPVQ